MPNMLWNSVTTGSKMLQELISHLLVSSCWKNKSKEALLKMFIDVKDSVNKCNIGWCIIMKVFVSISLKNPEPIRL